MKSIEGVADVVEVRGAQAGDAPPTLLVEVPHGATTRADFDRLKARLKGPFPDDLVDFYFVNTDVGAPETAIALAERFVADRPTTTAVVVRCRIPRTFVDCNRVIDPAAATGTSTAGGMTPGIVEYVKERGDVQALLAVHGAYTALVRDAFERVVGAGGFGVMLHSYAPRSVDVTVDKDIVARLKAAYAPGVVESWPLRPEVDLIARAPDGALLADAAVIDAVTKAFGAGGVVVGSGDTYPLHPSTAAYAYASRWPTRTLCLELRRDLLVVKFDPFVEMKVDAARAARMGGLLADGLRGVALA